MAKEMETKGALARAAGAKSSSNPETKGFLRDVVKSLPAETRGDVKIELKRDKSKGNASLKISSNGQKPEVNKTASKTNAANDSGKMQEKVPQKSETHNGNLNRSTMAAKGKEGTESMGKSNDPNATLRSNNMPKAEAVKEVDRNANAGAAVKAAKTQNESLCSDGSRYLNQPPLGSKFPSVVVNCSK